jgi:branched-chain amino acid transport system ATP-binding protein
MALALGPQVLLLDEPFAGLSEVEITDVLDLIHKLKAEFTLVIIEHKITRIMGLVTRLSVMHEGRLIADGLPDSILCDETVRRVYWGDVTCRPPDPPQGA